MLANELADEACNGAKEALWLMMRSRPKPKETKAVRRPCRRGEDAEQRRSRGRSGSRQKERAHDRKERRERERNLANGGKEKPTYDRAATRTLGGRYFRRQ